MPYVSCPKSPNIPTRAFTLVETLVAISILVIVVLGPIDIAVTGLKSAFFANERTVAVYLAQEAIEFFEGLRDENALDVLYGSGTDTWEWYDNVHSSCKTGTCDVNILTGGYRNCSSSSCVLEENPSFSFGEILYGYGSGWPSSIYTREVSLDDSDPLGLKMTVTVTWNSILFSSGPRSIVLETWLYDQYNRYEP